MTSSTTSRSNLYLVQKVHALGYRTAFEFLKLAQEFWRLQGGVDTPLPRTECVTHETPAGRGLIRAALGGYDLCQPMVLTALNRFESGKIEFVSQEMH